MADLKISQLTALATFADDDLLVIVDTSAVETKKVAWSSVKTALATAFGISVASTAIAVGTGSAIVGYVSDFYYSNATGEFNVSSAASNTYLHVNPASGQYQFGDIDVTGNKLYISDSGLITLSAGQGLYVNMSGANRLTTIGDSDFNGNGTYIRVNDATQVATFSSRAITIGSLAYIFPASQSANTFLKTDGSGNLTWAAAGSGTVTSFSAGDLSPLFTTSEANPTTTPALTFTLNTQNANKVFAGPTTGADAAPTFRALVAADIPSLSGTYLTIDGATTGATSQAQVFTSGIKAGVIDDNATGEIAFTISTVQKAAINTTGIGLIDGSAASPSYYFSSDSSTGFYLKAGNSELGTSVNGALVGGFNTTGLFAGLAGTLTGTLKFNGATSGTVTVQSAAAAGTWTLTLPTTDGNSGEFLQTNGSGVTTWAVPAGTGANTALSNLAAVAINTTLLPGSNDGAALGSGTLSFSDLFLASGAVVNFANGNSVITHSSAVLTVSTGDLRVTTAGTNATSVATLDGTQTLTNKSIVATQLTGTAYTMAVNNTSGTAAYTLTNYRNDVIADFDGTFTWNSTPPSTIVSQKYVMSRIGNMVILTISVLYTSTGTTNTTCIVTFPSTAPAPAVLAASGDAASEYMYPICGARVEANQTANPSAIRGGIRRNSGNSAFEILLIFGSTSALQLQVTVIYFTA